MRAGGREGSMTTPLKQTMLVIASSPMCDVCGGSGLSVDELAGGAGCSGYGRGKGVFRKVIERSMAEGKRRAQVREQNDAPESFKIGDYQT